MENKINLNDVRTAYSYKKTGELRFTYYMFRMLQHPRLVKALTGLAEKILRYNIPLKAVIRKTIFRIFCSGENIGEAFNTIARLRNYKVKSVLDYVSEGEKTEGAFSRNAAIIIGNVLRLGKEAPGNSVSVKLSGLEDPEFFRRINNVQAPMSTEDRRRFGTLLKRLEAICSEAAKHKVIVYIDAEDRYMQDVFDHLTELMMEKYNKTEAIVYNTLQMYLRDRPAYLERLIRSCREKKYFAGIKLVRGAYVEKENEAARAAGLPSPVFETKAQTDHAFNSAVETCIRNHDVVYTCIASHNAKSTLLAIECIERYKVEDHFTKVKFSQLLGMSDNLTFNLAAGGFNSSKYLPYGEIKKAIPYLIRRAEENSSINGQISAEVSYLKNELSRRKESRQLLLQKG